MNDQSRAQNKKKKTATIILSETIRYYVVLHIAEQSIWSNSVMLSGLFRRCAMNIAGHCVGVLIYLCIVLAKS